ncbi:hypothetical protein KAFR_0B01470 [Kazachstania africana CBS 2517]|uniref:Uncharacterized protein n=1 Tax=Kazachstania africana (strain ATCC 22294 / BCRC 22015 / CBS 2517 / CECT 1963 / NBRC 1671 / NRRL Y-8276) TaxID=1071382 RepID=H2APZ6_KAZAF|nr:hypothetical protein KAFR_0B01470 [Kazachstania africana CBS 2517]CCF56446.1 hypothetical protein KAFR_0B01470 [Kazachstania africana CBS 2517]
MDGLLINTEDTYTVAANEILAKYGKGPLTWDIKLKLQGLPGREAGEKLIAAYQLPITFEELDKLNVEVQNKLWPSSKFLPGAKELITYLHRRKIPIALCTSSFKNKFIAKTSHLPEMNNFDVIVTGDDPRIPKGRGKPHPDIWELGLKLLNDKFNEKISPEETIVFEDGIAGVKGGKTFGSQIVWVPHPEAYEYLGDTDAILDGRGELLKSLEDLEKTKYGL